MKYKKQFCLKDKNQMHSFISAKFLELMGIEDDIVESMILNYLCEGCSPTDLHVNLNVIMGQKTKIFIRELLNFLQ